MSESGDKKKDGSARRGSNRQTGAEKKVWGATYRKAWIEVPDLLPL